MENYFRILLCVLFFQIIGCDLIEEPDKILSEYNIGEKYDELNIAKNDIILRYNFDENMSEISIKVILKGYSKPEYFLSKSENLIVVDRGEYAVYLYFDKSGILIKKEIVGS